MDAELELIEVDIEQILVYSETSNPVSQESITKATNLLSKISSKVETICKSYEECESQFLKFEESRQDVS